MLQTARRETATTPVGQRAEVRILQIEPDFTPPGRWGVRLASKPTVSVVVVLPADRQRLAVCLERLIPQCIESNAETLVACSADAAEARELAAAYPNVRFVFAPAGSTAAFLRTTGLAAARGDVVTFVDEHTEIPPDLVRQMTLSGQQPMA
jgi:glycosyltransferase involved in cell wall biosynthesis